MAERIFLTRPLHAFAMDELGSRYDVAVHRGEAPASPGELLEGVRSAAGLVCFPYDRIGRDVIDAAPGLRVISTYSVGYDHVDVRYAASRGIAVGHTPGVLTDATADLAFGLVLDLLRGITRGDRDVRAGRWRRPYGPDERVGRDLRGAALGIVGLGRIGRAVAARAGAFGMRVSYHGRRRAPAGVERALGAAHVGLDRLLSESDVVSVHVPHTPATDGMIGAAELGMMRPSAFLVNTSRGRVVDEGALARALGDGSIAGAGLDVFESEPVGADHPLAGLENAVLLPHIGSAAAGTREEMARIAVGNLDRGMRGERLLHAAG